MLTVNVLTSLLCSYQQHSTLLDLADETAQERWMGKNTMIQTMSLMAQLLGRASQAYEMLCLDPRVMRLNPGRVELGVQNQKSSNLDIFTFTFSLLHHQVYL